MIASTKFASRKKSLALEDLLKDKKKERDRIILSLENQARMLTEELLRAQTGEQRSEILKRISYDQDKIKEALDYNRPTSRTVSRTVTNSTLYRNGARYREIKKFEREYGKKKGDYVYGAVVGKVKRERGARTRRYGRR